MARKAKPHVVVTFHTTTSALALQKAAARCGLRGRLAPIPRQLSAGCGLAWREPAGGGEGGAAPAEGAAAPAEEGAVCATPAEKGATAAEAAVRAALEAEGIEAAGVARLDL